MLLNKEFMMRSIIIEDTKVTIVKADITTLEVEAVVNAANSSLLGGGGVDGAIHRAGGAAILDECRMIRARQGSLETGGAVITTGGNLPAKYVIHTVGPVWQGGGKGEEELLKSCYRKSLLLGRENGVERLAFPSVSTGIYGYPIEMASRTAFETVLDFIKVEKHSYSEIIFCLFSEGDYNIYSQLISSVEEE